MNTDFEQIEEHARDEANNSRAWTLNIKSRLFKLMPNAVAACNILLPLVTLSSKVTGEILIDDIHSSSYIHFFAFSYNTPDNQTERIRIRISKKRAAEYYKDISAVAGNYTIISCHGGRIEMSKQRSLSADCFALLVNTPYSATRLLCFTTLLF